MAKFTLIIRPQPDADRDVGWLQRYRVPALASPAMTGISRLCDLPDPAGFGGVIFTSRHAVETMMTAARAAAWIAKPAFVVGAATAAAAAAAGFSKIITGRGGGGGLTEPIRQAIMSDNAFAAGPLFWPSAVDISFDMAAALRRYDIDVMRLPVYQMTACAGLAPRVAGALAADMIAAVVAMSPRSIQIFRDHLHIAGQEAALANISLIAGSQAIAAAAGAGWKTVYVARQPRRSRLLAIAVLRHRRDDMR